MRIVTRSAIRYPIAAACSKKSVRTFRTGLDSAKQSPDSSEWIKTSSAATRSNLDSSAGRKLDSLADFRLARGRRPELGSLPQKP